MRYSCDFQFESLTNQRADNDVINSDAIWCVDSIQNCFCNVFDLQLGKHRDKFLIHAAQHLAVDHAWRNARDLNWHFQVAQFLSDSLAERGQGMFRCGINSERWFHWVRNVGNAVAENAVQYNDVTTACGFFHNFDGLPQANTRSNDIHFEHFFEIGGLVFNQKFSDHHSSVVNKEVEPSVLLLDL